MSREYIFTLEVEDEEVLWKCVVGEDEVVTYEGDVECKHLKIMNHEKKPGVLQIDCVTKVYDEILPFQLENGMPFIKIEGEWVASDTTIEDRLQAKIRAYKKESFVYIVAGVLTLVGFAIWSIVTGKSAETPIVPVLGIFSISSGMMTMVRLKNELEAMGRTFDWKIRWEDLKKQK